MVARFGLPTVPSEARQWSLVVRRWCRAICRYGPSIDQFRYRIRSTPQAWLRLGAARPTITQFRTRIGVPRVAQATSSGCAQETTLTYAPTLWLACHPHVHGSPANCIKEPRQLHCIIHHGDQVTKPLQGLHANRDTHTTDMPSNVHKVVGGSSGAASRTTHHRSCRTESPRTPGVKRLGRPCTHDTLSQCPPSAQNQH